MRKKKHLGFWVVLAAWTLGFSLLSSQAKASPEVPIKTAICELAKHPKQFHEKVVEVFAYYENDGVRHNEITDPSCPNVRVVLILNMASDGLPSLALALAKGQQGTQDKSISGTFQGWLTWKPNEKHSLVIWVTKIEGLTVVPNKASVSAETGEQISTNEASLLADNLPEKTTVCEIMKNTEQYDGRRVLVSVFIESDAMHGSFLVDASCPHVGIPLGPSISNKGMEELHTAIWKGLPGTIDKTITVTVKGIFMWAPDSFPTHELIIEEIHDMKTWPKSPDDPWNQKLFEQN